MKFLLNDLLIKPSFYTRDSLSDVNKNKISDANKYKHQNQVITKDPNCHVWINAFPPFKCTLQEEMAATDVMELLEQRRVNVIAKLFVSLTFNF